MNWAPLLDLVMLAVIGAVMVAGFLAAVLASEHLSKRDQMAREDGKAAYRREHGVVR